MKTNHLITCICACVIISGIFLTGCKSYIEEDIGSPVNSEFEKAKTIITQMGFDTEGMVPYEDAYIVEGDILISKTEIEEFDANQTKHTYYGNSRKVTNTGLVMNDRMMIEVAADDNLPSSWNNALTEAIAKWNSIPDFGIFFIKKPYPGIQHIKVSPWTGLIEETGENNLKFSIAELPSGGKPGKNIYINLNFKPITFDNSQKLMQMVHALGHAIGFGHTVSKNGEVSWSVEPDAPSGEINIPGTETSSDFSVMFKSNLTWGWDSRFFSQGDLTAAKIMYPYTPPPVIPDNVHTDIIGKTLHYVNQSANFSLLIPNGGYAVEVTGWEAKSSTGKNIPIYKDILPLSAYARFSEKGYYTITATGNIKLGVTSQPFNVSLQVKVINERPTFSTASTTVVAGTGDYHMLATHYLGVDNVDYEWDIPSGLNYDYDGASMRVNITYPNPGVYTIGCRAKDGNVYSEWAYITITAKSASQLTVNKVSVFPVNVSGRDVTFNIETQYPVASTINITFDINAALYDDNQMDTRNVFFNATQQSVSVTYKMASDVMEASVSNIRIEPGNDDTYQYVGEY